MIALVAFRFGVWIASIMLHVGVRKMGLGKKGKELRSFMRIMAAQKVTDFWTYRKAGRVNVRFTF